MSVDQRILPEYGTYYNDSFVFSKTLYDLFDEEDEDKKYLTIDAETGAQRRNQSNCYAVYAGGDGLLNSWSGKAHLESGIWEQEFNAEDRHLVNISLLITEANNTNGQTYVEPHNNSAWRGFNTYDLIQKCPVISFNPNNFILGIQVELAKFTGSDMESESMATEWRWFSALYDDPDLAGLLEDGCNYDEGTGAGYAIIGWNVIPFLGEVIPGGSQRTRFGADGRKLEICVENYSLQPDVQPTLVNNIPQFHYGAYGYCNENNIGNWQWYEGRMKTNQSEWIQLSNTSADQGSGKLTSGKGGYRSNHVSGEYIHDYILDSSSPPYDITMPDILNGTYGVGSQKGFRVIPELRIFYKWSRWGNEPLFAHYIPGELILKSVAAFGLYFTEYQEAALTSSIGPTTTDSRVHLGIYEGEDNYTYGNWVSGADCAKEPQASWTNAVEDAQVIPSNPSDPVPEPPEPWEKDPQTEIRNAYGIGSSIGSEDILTYESSLSNAIAEANDLVTREASSASSLDDFEKWKSTQIIGRTEPAGTIISCTAYTFPLQNAMARPGEDPANLPNSVRNGRINFGKMEISLEPISTIGFYHIDSVDGRNQILDGGKCQYRKQFNNFLDYPPYSSAELYIPYCGSVNIDPNIFVGHEISVKYIVDWISGACLALIFRDGLVVDQVSGQMGNKLSITNADTLNFERNVVNQMGAVKAAKVQAVGSQINAGASMLTAGASVISGGIKAATTKNPSGLIGAAGHVAEAYMSYQNAAVASQKAQIAEYNLETTPINFKELSTATPNTSACNEAKCRLVIYRPVLLPDADVDKFKLINGFACLNQGFVGQSVGFTQVDGFNWFGKMGAPPHITEQEVAAIKTLLKGGVFIAAEPEE